MFHDIETPALILDRTVLQRNADHVLKRAAAHGVTLRPHLKTAKSVDVANVVMDGRMSTVTVSTLREAEHFARAGYTDILYAVGIAPHKFAHVQRIEAETGAELRVITDSADTACAAATWSGGEGRPLRVLIEIDSGEHRGGLLPDDPRLVEIARILQAGPGSRFEGVMTHAGHSYGRNLPEEIAAIAEDERQAVTGAATRIREAGIPVDIVSAGSTPTFIHARTLEGLTEVRCGVYVFYDLAQMSRNVCRQEDIALSVLATVIGHNRQAGAILLDSGALALSKDVSAQDFLPDAGYGYVCDAVTMERFGQLSVNAAYQEHGKVLVLDGSWFDRLPVGSQVRVLPNHACMTAAAGYGRYIVVEEGRVAAAWPRVDGW